MTKELRGPVVEHEGYFWLLIPLEPEGKHFVDCSKGVSMVEDGYLKIFIAGSIAEKIGVRDGSMVRINNHGGKLNVEPEDPN